MPQGSLWLALSAGGKVCPRLPPSVFISPPTLTVFLINNKEGVIHLMGQSLTRHVLLASVVTVL